MVDVTRKGLNAFMSLIATISLDLSKWSSFLTTPVGTIIPTLFKVGGKSEGVEVCRVVR